MWVSPVGGGAGAGLEANTASWSAWMPCGVSRSTDTPKRAPKACLRASVAVRSHSINPACPPPHVGGGGWGCFSASWSGANNGAPKRAFLGELAKTGQSGPRAGLVEPARGGGGPAPCGAGGGEPKERPAAAPTSAAERLAVGLAESNKPAKTAAGKGQPRRGKFFTLRRQKFQHRKKPRAGKSQKHGNRDKSGPRGVRVSQVRPIPHARSRKIKS